MQLCLAVFFFVETVVCGYVGDIVPVDAQEVKSTLFCLVFSLKYFPYDRRNGFGLPRRSEVVLSLYLVASMRPACPEGQQVCLIAVGVLLTSGN